MTPVMVKNKTAAITALTGSDAVLSESSVG